MQKHIEAVPNPEEPWESGALGRDAAHVVRAPADLKEQIDEALGLQMISIRLQRELIAELKAIAAYRGIGYQPLIRDVLRRFTRSELLTMTIELQEKQKAMESLQVDQANSTKIA
jgi:hypothetical protein